MFTRCGKSLNGKPRHSKFLHGRPQYGSPVGILLLLFLLGIQPCWASDGAALVKAIDGKHRTPANVVRDIYRHPYEALHFFGIQPQMTVVEIWPGAGWWTEILAPYLREQGVYYVAGFATTAHRTPQWRKNVQVKLNDRLAATPAVYDHVVVTELSIPERTVIAPPGSVDRVLTFRNVHNWMKGGYAEGMFQAMYRSLQPGGILGVVEHRAKPGTSLDLMIESGYVTEKHMVTLARQAGFELLEASELNANPKDNRDHPRGVWTLPPTLRFCKTLAESEQVDCLKRYREIGESDRMTLKFIKK